MTGLGLRLEDRGVPNLQPQDRRSPMSQTPISPLRQRMTEDMTVRKLGAATQRNYIRAVKTLSEFLGRSPGTATPEDLRRFQVHQSAAGAQPPVMNSTVTALRFFFRVTLDRPEMARHLTLVRQPRKLPSVLSEEEVVRLLEAANGLKYKAALSIAYSITASVRSRMDCGI